jgi:hypothetical protein
VGNKVKIHKITPATGKERGDLEIKDYVILQKTKEQADRLPPPRTLILDFTMTHPRYGRSLLNLNGQLTNTRRSDGAPEPDGAIKVVARKKMIHYRQLYMDRPEPIAFMPAAVDTSGRIYDDFLRLLFLHAHREASALANDIPEESGQFRFLRAACLANIKGSVHANMEASHIKRRTHDDRIPPDAELFTTIHSGISFNAAGLHLWHRPPRTGSVTSSILCWAPPKDS